MENALMNKYIKHGFLAGILLSTGLSNGGIFARADGKLDTEVKSTHMDIKRTLGIIPTFFKKYPKEGISSAWEEMKSLQLNTNSMLPGKIKELIALAVSSQIPCQYCTYFHTEFAKLNGATDREITESVAIAGDTRKWSTILYGAQVDHAVFRNEVDRIVAHQKGIVVQDKNKARMTTPVQTDRPTAELQIVRNDIETTFGFFPTFMSFYPEASLPSAWKFLKSFSMNSATAIPPKYKDLISLAVGSQTSCQYCTYWDTEFAKLDGAQNTEIQEAVALAGVVRHWSTFINGIQMDEKLFRMEVSQIIKYSKSQMAKPMASLEQSAD